jgi:hypothetical protein
MLPRGVLSATAWREMSSLPTDFVDSAAYRSPAELADAFGAAIFASFAGSPERPELALDTIDESPERATLLITETGVGDDSVAGRQYALVIVRGGEGWIVDELWIRALCRRGGDAELCT